ncbi:MAG: DUF58 domain-containing protein [Planctomycetes bacterium]|nr:DUF58 domain-containing protein [Planctomycetota bacterium]
MARIGQLDVVSRKIFSGKIQGERRSKRRGQSVEFADFRPYVHGDDLRFIDWNIFGRLDRLFLKIFLEEEDLSLLVAVDTSASMDWGDPNKLAYAQRLAMALGYVGLVNHNRVTMAAFGGEGGLRILKNLRGRRRTSEMGRWLLDLQPGGANSFEESMKSLAVSRQGRGVMLVISDFLFKEGYEKGLRYVAGRGYDLWCLQTLAPQEIDPAAHGLAGDWRLTDAEDRDEAEVTASAGLIDQYRANLGAWCAGLRDFAVRRSIMHLVVDTSTDVDVLLLEYLRRRGLLR